MRKGQSPPKILKFCVIFEDVEVLGEGDLNFLTKWVCRGSGSSGVRTVYVQKWGREAWEMGKMGSRVKTGAVAA